MLAAWYDRTGPAAEVLTVGELADPEPGPGEVRVRVHAAGLNPRDVKRREGAGDRVMTDPRVIPGDDGAGVIDRVGPGADASRLGERVWVHFANYLRSFGTMAEYVVVPQERAVPLPAQASFDQGACLGIPALTAHRALFADGPIAGQIVLVTGGAGAVGHYAIEIARHAGARVIATASTDAKREAARAAGAEHVIDYRRPDAARLVLDASGGHGVDRVVDVALGHNLPLTSAVLAVNGTNASYSSQSQPEPPLPFYPLMRLGASLRLISVFTTPEPALQAATAEITDLLARGALTHPIAARYPLTASPAAHEMLERGGAEGKVLVMPR